MKTPKKYYIQMAIGLLITSSDFIIKRFYVLTDFSDGFIKGIGLAIMLLAIYKLSARKKQQE